jgi:hypothetical protein
MNYQKINHSETNARKELMKIRSVSFGLGGYQGCQFGLFLDFEQKGGSGVSDFVTGGWDYQSIKVDEYTKWTEKERDHEMTLMCKTISKILSAAKVNDVQHLKGKPVEVVIEGNMLKSWRILEEVI